MRVRVCMCAHLHACVCACICTCVWVCARVRCGCVSACVYVCVCPFDPRSVLQYLMHAAQSSSPNPTPSMRRQATNSTRLSDTHKATPSSCIRIRAPVLHSWHALPRRRHTQVANTRARLGGVRRQGVEAERLPYDPVLAAPAREGKEKGGEWRKPGLTLRQRCFLGGFELGVQVRTACLNTACVFAAQARAASRRLRACLAHSFLFPLPELGWISEL